MSQIQNNFAQSLQKTAKTLEILAKTQGNFFKTQAGGKSTNFDCRKSVQKKPCFTAWSVLCTLKCQARRCGSLGEGGCHPRRPLAWVMALEGAGTQLLVLVHFFLVQQVFLVKIGLSTKNL